jgi:conjugal transfer pilus assembly protein TraW
MQKFTTTALFISLVFGSATVYSKNLGKIGQTYPIKETDMLELIYSKLNKLQETGELERINNKMATRARLERPAPVMGLSSTKVYKKWIMDPSITLASDITNLEGDIIAKAGTRVNPLSYISLRSTLVFYDGDDKKQVAWAQEQNKRLKSKAKLILVKGSITEQVELFKKRVFFDQNGLLTRKFGIHHIPALVTQEGLNLRIEEVLP